ncbi:PepSY domain-containing protein [Candidatus Oscillochloris fontis]|uniref:PepSY domain-containing protein n=1 Tax=Candidatus Oscillochloris fontis TaxID=2496868 RepID=UPI00101C63C2|nr:PepSY domain-containing protein [Candidatus Oscillochloris fontis]
MNARSSRTIVAVGVALVLIVIGVVISNQGSRTAPTTTQPTSVAPAIIPTTQATAPVINATSVPSNSYAVTADQAGSIALATAPGTTLQGTPVIVTYQGATVYEVTLDTGMVYVDATSGQVVASTVPNSSTTNTNGGGEGDDDDDEHDDDD